MGTTPASESEHLVIRPRRGLPGSRSVVGGLLVALAALAGWFAVSEASKPPTSRYLVATRTIGPGEQITRADLAFSTVELPADLRRGSFSDPSTVVGRLALGPIGVGELVQATALSTAEVQRSEQELTFPLSQTWALGGRLKPGDHIDVFATYGDGPSSQTIRVLQDVVVRRLDQATDGRIGNSTTQAITVALASQVPVARVVNAAQTAELTISRISGGPQSTGEEHAHYRAESDLFADEAHG